jgi:predicted Fe-S protein YdhL (DUF1289 family)
VGSPFRDIAIVNSSTATEHDRYASYTEDYQAWIAHAAPRIAARLAFADDTQYAHTWSLMKPDTRAAVWKALDDTQRERIFNTWPLLPRETQTGLWELLDAQQKKRLSEERLKAPKAASAA